MYLIILWTLLTAMLVGGLAWGVILAFATGDQLGAAGAFVLVAGLAGVLFAGLRDTWRQR